MPDRDTEMDPQLGLPEHVITPPLQQHKSTAIVVNNDEYVLKIYVFWKEFGEIYAIE
jgi:hypothetical protein